MENPFDDDLLNSRLEDLKTLYDLTTEERLAFLDAELETLSKLQATQGCRDELHQWEG